MFPLQDFVARVLMVTGIALLAVTVLGLFRWRSAVPLTSPQAQSVAVLPFADLSEHHDQEYFADGIAEEVRDLLALKGDPRFEAIVRRLHPHA